jgi:hypothetical protein
MNQAPPDPNKTARKQQQQTLFCAVVVALPAVAAMDLQQEELTIGAVASQREELTIGAFASTGGTALLTTAFVSKEEPMVAILTAAVWS